MIRKVYVSLEGKATFVCPACENLVRRDVAEYGRLEQAVRIRVRCPCGHRYSVDLDRRQYYRAVVKLPGVVFSMVRSIKKERRPMNVTDLSRSGLRFQLTQEGAIAVGDRLYVEFMLNDVGRTLIGKEVRVRKVKGKEIGAEFVSTDACDAGDQALGFYFLTGK